MSLAAAPSAQAKYQGQVTAWCDDLAAGCAAAVLPALVGRSDRRDVERYIENAVGERYRMLHEETRMLALAFPALDEQMVAYCHDTPRATYTYGERELVCFLRWLRRQGPLTPQQADFVTYHEAECACLALAWKDQQAHREFQRRAADRASLCDGSIQSAAQRWQLNPIRVWACLSGAAVGLVGATMEHALFYAAGQEVRMLWLPVAEMQLVWQLELLASATLAEWSLACGVDRAQVAQVAEKLATAGLLATV